MDSVADMFMAWQLQRYLLINASFLSAKDSALVTARPYLRGTNARYIHSISKITAKKKQTKKQKTKQY